MSHLNIELRVMWKEAMKRVLLNDTCQLLVLDSINFESAFDFQTTEFLCMCTCTCVMWVHIHGHMEARGLMFDVLIIILYLSF